jgi:hypothetical protein
MAKKQLTIATTTDLTAPVSDDFLEQFAGLGHENTLDEWKDAPPWSNEEAQLEYIRTRLLAGWTLRFPYRSEEELAVEKALCGKPEQLADWIEQPNAELSQSTRKLIAEFLRGERSLSSGRAGKTRHNPGPSRKTENQRRRDNPTRQAAEIFLVLRDHLPLIYPNETRRNIRSRAMDLVAKLKGVEPDTIQDHLDKSKKRRGLLYRIYGYQEEHSNPSWCLDLIV